MTIHLAADAEVEEEAKVMDWGTLVTISQGGTDIYVVGLSRRDAAECLEAAAKVLRGDG